MYFALKMCQNFSRFYMFIVCFNSLKKSMSVCVCVCMCVHTHQDSESKINGVFFFFLEGAPGFKKMVFYESFQRGFCVLELLYLSFILTLCDGLVGTRWRREASRDSELEEDQPAALSGLCGLVLEQAVDSLGSRWNELPLSLLSINIISSKFSVRPQFFLSYIISIISKIIREMMKERIWKIAIDSTIAGVACFPADSWFMDVTGQGQGSVLKVCLEEFPRALGSCWEKSM